MEISLRQVMVFFEFAPNKLLITDMNLIRLAMLLKTIISFSLITKKLRQNNIYNIVCIYVINCYFCQYGNILAKITSRAI